MQLVIAEAEIKDGVQGVGASFMDKGGDPNEIAFWPYHHPPEKIPREVFHLNPGHIYEDQSNGSLKLIT